MWNIANANINIQTSSNSIFGNNHNLSVAYLDSEPTCFPQRKNPWTPRKVTALPRPREALLGSVQVAGEGWDAALHDLRVLVLVLADAVEVLDVAGATQQLHKVLVVGDDQQLEVALAGATLDDPVCAGKHTQKVVNGEMFSSSSWDTIVTQTRSRKEPTTTQQKCWSTAAEKGVSAFHRTPATHTKFLLLSGDQNVSI